jgi:predicted O-methyltransferase YrrM
MTGLPMTSVGNDPKLTEEVHSARLLPPPDSSVAVAARLYGQRLEALFSDMLESIGPLALHADEAQVRRFPERLALAFSYLESPLRQIFPWLFQSREITNLTYDLTETNKNYLAALISLVTAVPMQQVRKYVDEPNGDGELREHVRTRTLQSPYQDVADTECHYGRRLGWYAFVRAMKPRVVVETGVDKGLGSVLLTSALARNAEEGSRGHYYGTDINPDAGYLLQGRYREHGSVLYGDSIESLKTLDAKIDLFINDSDHSADYEAAEYEVVHAKLTSGAVILGDNSHCTDALYRYSMCAGRGFLFFREEPENHWYPGAGIGVSFSKAAVGCATP